MNIEWLDIPGACLITPKVFDDARGYFMESFHTDRYGEAGLPTSFVQDNLSYSRQGVLRGLHYQWPRPQGKLVQCLYGEIDDVVVDIRQGSPAFARHVVVRLTGENARQIYIPEGCAHGFLVLSEEAVFSYKCTDFYAPDCERGLAWNDPDLAIVWALAQKTPGLSPKDEKLPFLGAVPQNHLPVYRKEGKP
jgi:dTDP-4-dehydrorhamnose 3,5-epimerase